MVKTRVPYAVHLGDIEEVHAKDVLGAFTDQTRPILVIGGSPCNGRNYCLADVFYLIIYYYYYYF